MRPLLFEMGNWGLISLKWKIEASSVWNGKFRAHTASVWNSSSSFLKCEIQTTSAWNIKLRPLLLSESQESCRFDSVQGLSLVSFYFCLLIFLSAPFSSTSTFTCTCQEIIFPYTMASGWVSASRAGDKGSIFRLSVWVVPVTCNCYPARYLVL